MQKLPEDKQEEGQQLSSGNSWGDQKSPEKVTSYATLFGDLPKMSTENLHLYRDVLLNIKENLSNPLSQEHLLEVEQFRTDLRAFKRDGAGIYWKKFISGLEQEGGAIYGYLSVSDSTVPSESRCVIYEKTERGITEEFTDRFRNLIRVAPLQDLLKLVNVPKDKIESALYTARMSGEIPRLPERQDLVDLHERNSLVWSKVYELQSLADGLIRGYMVHDYLSVQDPYRYDYVSRLMLNVKGRVYTCSLYSSERSLKGPEDYVRIITLG